jgi:hypothetical protein
MSEEENIPTAEDASNKQQEDLNHKRITSSAPGTSREKENHETNGKTNCEAEVFVIN